MKKYVSVLAIALGFYCISCNSKSEGGLSPTAQKNLDAMHGVSKCFDTKDFSKLDMYIAQDAVDHAGESGDVKGLANIKAEFEKWVAATDNGSTETIKDLADDEYAMSWQRYTGTYKTDGQGHKAGDKYDMKAIEVAKFKDGKATEHWTMMDPGEVMKMMGNMQQPKMPADTTKKM
jgi:ketosteroid isomerase-like protein